MTFPQVFVPLSTSAAIRDCRVLLTAPQSYEGRRECPFAHECGELGGIPIALTAEGLLRAEHRSCRATR